MRLPGDETLKRLKKVKLFVLDMDGTVYLGDELFPWSERFFDVAVRLGKKYVFLTNNSSKSKEEYEEKLRRMGIPHPVVYTSGEATVSFVKEKFPGKKAFVLGTRSLRKVFERAGVEVTEYDPEVLVLGYDTEVTYEKIAKFALFLRKGLPYVATHPDINCPSPEGFLPDAGSFIALFEVSTSRRPDYIIGKPNPQILFEIAKMEGVRVEEVAVVGDRLYTDMELARRANALSILVLSGETRKEDVDESRVDMVVENIGELASILEEVMV